MTETTEPRIELPHAVQQFVLNWGTLGDRWGVNRSVSLIHALLYASERPLTADEIAATLEIARSNVSTSLRELQTWDIVRAVPVRGDRRVFYAAETDLWTLVSRIAARSQGAGARPGHDHPAPMPAIRARRQRA